MRTWIEKGVRNWTIYTDYCIDDRTKEYNAIVFTIIPYVDDLNDLRKFIGNIATSDLKHIRRIDKRFCEFVKSGYVYNVAIVYKKGGDQFINRGSKTEFMKHINVVYEAFEKWATNTADQQLSMKFREVVKKLNFLKQEMRRKSFNLNLFRSIVLVQSIAAYLMFVLTNQPIRQPDIIAWFSDRDKIVAAYRGIVYDLVWANYHNLCDASGLKGSQIAFMEHDLHTKNTWVDEVLRIPDYLCGALANRIRFDDARDKYDDLLELAIADNPYLTIFGLFTEKGVDKVNIISVHRTSA